MAYLNRYRQVTLLREIEKKFTAATGCVQARPPSKFSDSGPRSLAAAKRNRPVPGAGHYDKVVEQYVKATQ